MNAVLEFDSRGFTELSYDDMMAVDGGDWRGVFELLAGSFAIVGTIVGVAVCIGAAKATGGLSVFVAIATAPATMSAGWDMAISGANRINATMAARAG